MKMKKFASVLLILSLTLLVLGACSGNDNLDDKPVADAKEKVIIATGPADGTYHLIGKDIARVLVDSGIDAEVITTEGSMSNLKHLKSKDAHLAIVMKDAIDDDVKANLIVELHPEVVQIIATEESNITSVSQLKGKRVAVGIKGSGIEDNADEILDDYGLEYKDFDMKYMDADEAITLLKEGKLDAAFVTGNFPNKKITALAKDKKIVVLPVGTDRVMDDLIGEGYIKHVIPAETYGNKKDVETLSVKNVLVAHTDVSDAMVKNIKAALEPKIKDILKKY
ncbi:MAG: TAXI family TRAP transporter solute-binding subunit [Anaerovoracaceae bacterium]